MAETASAEGIKNEEGQFVERGSFEWYLDPVGGGGFVKALARCIQRADSQNLERLRRGFPQMVAAYEMRSWFEAPPGFEARYNAGAAVTWACRHCHATYGTRDEALACPCREAGGERCDE